MTPGVSFPLRVLLPFALAASVGACASNSRDMDRRPEPIPWADTLPIPEPGESEESHAWIAFTEWIRDEAASAVSLRRLVSGWEPALNVTAFDDVVPSAWYEHRIDELSPEDIRNGPPGSPPADGPLTVVDAKLVGVQPGFTVRDSKGDRYLLKFDPPAYMGMASGADAVSSRLFWAAGYNVPRDDVIHFRRGRLEIDPDATIADVDGERGLREEDVDSVLARTAAGPEGRYRALASLYLEGTPKGMFRFEGRREDDPNDYYPHQHRRELRGLWVVAAWLNHVDLMARNTLSTFIEPTGYLKHYLIDFGTTLGSGSIRVLNPKDGFEHSVDLEHSFGRLLTLGAHEVGWEDLDGTPLHPSLGWMPVEAFDPAEWRPFIPNEAFRRVTPADGYWGARRVAELDSTRIAAAVAAGEYTTVAADTLISILLLRRDRVLRHWFSQVAPLEAFDLRMSPDSLTVSFDDLAVHHGIRDASGTCYRWKLTGMGSELEGRSCGTGPLTIPLDATSSGSPVLEIRVDAPNSSDRAVRVNLSVDGGTARIRRIRH